MATTRVQTNFTAGELDPKLFGRVETSQYRNGAARLRNVLALPQGGVEKRPGWRWVSETDMEPSRLIPFESSTGERYMLCFSHFSGLVRAQVYKSGEVVHEFGTGILAEFLPTINWAQSLDTLIIVAPGLAPRRIAWFDDEDWTSETLPFSTFPLHQFEPDVSTPQGDLTPSGFDGLVELTLSTGTGDYEWSSADVGQFVEGNGGRARIVNIQSTSVADAIVEIPFYNTNQIDQGDWELDAGYEPAWSVARGWPRSVAFHQGRLWIGGSRDLPDTLWGSRAGDFFNFRPDQGLDDDAISLQMFGDTIPVIRDMKSAQNLQIFTSDGEFFIPQAQGQPITPDNASIQRATNRGVEPNLRVQEVSGATLFVQRGGKAVREFLFLDTEQNYTAQNISLLSSHLLQNPRDVALRPATSTDETDALYVVNGDGTIAALTTLRDQEITTWSLLETQGQVLQVGVDFDDVYVVVEREIDGQARRYVELWTPGLNMDCGVYREVDTPTDVVDGLDHLEGMEVEVRIDGSMQPPAVVEDGEIQLERDAEEVIELGLAFRPEVQDMPVVFERRDGYTPFQRRKRVVETTLLLFETSNITVNGNQPAFRQFGPAGGGSPLDQPPQIFTGRKIVEGMLGWDEFAQLTISQNAPAPFTLLAIEKQVSV